MKPYSKQLYELMARCIANEASPGDVERFGNLLAADEKLRIEVETYKLMIRSKGSQIREESDTKEHFMKLRDRLKKDGLV